VTELSTPPDMATTIRASLAGRARSKLGDIGGVFTRISLLVARAEPIEVSQGTLVARHEPKFKAAAESKLHAEELLALLGEARSNCDRERQDAIACYLSSSEGWTKAVERLGGAFAARPGELRERKAD